MTKTVIFGNQKGGVGKSTCAILTAGTFSSAPFNLRVTVIDADEQQTISILHEASRLNGQTCNWNVVSFPGPIKGVERKKFDRILDQTKENADLVLIDLPGYLDTDGKTANVSPEADYVFIPVPPTNKDVPSSEDYLNFMLNIKNIVQAEFDHEIKVIPFCNMYKRNHSSTGFIKSVFDDWKKRYHVEAMKRMLGRYVEHEDVGVGNSLYKDNTTNKGVNYTQWINELAKIMDIK
jgi:cellulose biosynthesis protein BcsQ